MGGVKERCIDINKVQKEVEKICREELKKDVSVILHYMPAEIQINYKYKIIVIDEDTIKITHTDKLDKMTNAPLVEYYNLIHNTKTVYYRNTIPYEPWVVSHKKINPSEIPYLSLQKKLVKYIKLIRQYVSQIIPL